GDSDAHDRVVVGNQNFDYGVSAVLFIRHSFSGGFTSTTDRKFVLLVTILLSRIVGTKQRPRTTARVSERAAAARWIRKNGTKYDS
ncbi:MAG: hypothetical protein OEN20_04020, partial [Gammaproteobacteria bacterium]|nr:hypothetical protein [Gammaproteobacteria bacterium]